MILQSNAEGAALLRPFDSRVGRAFRKEHPRDSIGAHYVVSASSLAGSVSIGRARTI